VFVKVNDLAPRAGSKLIYERLRAWARVGSQDPQRLAGLAVPQPDCAVVPRACQCPRIGREGTGPYRQSMSLERTHFRAGLYVEEMNRHIGSANGQDLAVWRKGKRDNHELIRATGAGKASYQVPVSNRPDRDVPAPAS